MENNPGTPGSVPPPPGGGSAVPPPPVGGPPPPSGGGSDLIPPPATPKDPVLILVLNLIFFCVGYFIFGQWQKGLATIAIVLILTVGTCFMGTPALPLIMIFTAIDGYMQAEELKKGFPLGQWTFLRNHK